MAVIKRAVLYGQAKEIADKAISKTRVYDPNLIALQQQRDILDAQQQSLIAGTQNTLRDVSQNIYQAKRQARAASASLGLIGDLAISRNQKSLQSNINNELARVIDQTEQGAINIAGQQSAINKAEVQYAQDAILSQYADTLIDEGNVAISRDRGREAFSAITGVLSGALTGFLGGKAFGWSTKALKDPTTGWFKKGLAGTALGLLPVMGARSIYGITDKDDRLTNDIFNYGGLTVGLTGLAGGISRGIYDASRRKDIASILGGDYLTNGITMEDLANQETLLGNKLNYKNKPVVWEGGKKRAEAFVKNTTAATKNVSIREARRLAAAEASAQKLTGVARVNKVSKAGAKAFGQKTKNFFSTKNIGGALGKLNLATTITATALGAILGGIGAGTKQRYRLDLNKLMEQDTAQQFADFGLDLDALTDKVYDEYRRPWD